MGFRGVGRGTAGAVGPGMRSYSLEMDLVSGAMYAVAKDGRRYTMTELGAAEQAAARGDPEAAALLRAVDFAVDDDGRQLSSAEVRARFEQVVHDCPECQAARARGEEPIAWSSVDLIGGPRERAGRPARGRRRGRQRRRRFDA